MKTGARESAHELDQRVAERTAELTAANEELRKEVAKLRRAEETLPASELEFRLLVDNIPTFVALLTATGGIELINRQILDYTGKTFEELKRWGTSDLVHPDDLPHAIETFTKAMNTGEPFEIVYRMRRFDGVYRWFHGRHRPLSDLNGRVVRWCVTVTDIDDRKRAEEALQRSETFLKEAQHVSSTGSFSWRVATNEITWSEEVYRLYGLDPAVPVTLEAILSRSHPDLPFTQEIITQARSGVDDFDFERRLVMPDHSIRYVHVVAHGTRNQRGELELFGTLHDVTQRRQSEEALDKVRSELFRVARVTTLGALTASIAHEVTQPLSGIITNASTCLRMLDADPPNIDGARETARRTIRDGNRASDVITRLRALFSNKEITVESVDLNDAAREVVALSTTELQNSGASLRTKFAEDLPPVTGDRVQLQQVILNLLRNASDAMRGVYDRPRQLIISTERDQGDGVRLAVQDVGVGFNPQAADRLFEAFYTTKSGGLGMGLSVSRSIIERHHGRLSAALNRHGPGATFSFSLPREPAATPS